MEGERYQFWSVMGSGYMDLFAIKANLRNGAPQTFCDIDEAGQVW